MKTIIIMCLAFFLSCLDVDSMASEIKGRPLKFISSCNLDLNNDGSDDIALLVETDSGRELIILVRKPEGFDAFLISNVAQYEYLSCYYGDSLQETSVGKGNKKGRVFKTPGAYVELAHPEGPSRAYFWNGKDFTEVQIAD